jgi:hypothetical protein
LTPAIALAMLLALLLPGLAAAKKDDHSDNGKGKVVGVMTRNLYLGADLGPVIAAETPEQVVTASGAILRDVIANDFPTRAEGLADEILRTRPDLVGLQEVAFWQTTPITPAGTALTIDYLDLLLDELNQGPGPDRYEVVVVQNEFGTEVPADANGVADDGPGGELADAEVLGKLLMRDVILARTGAACTPGTRAAATSKRCSNCPLAAKSSPSTEAGPRPTPGFAAASRSTSSTPTWRRSSR